MNKILITLLLVVANCMCCMGQKIVVKSFEVSPTDITAAYLPRTDSNGEACAVVKVQLPSEITQFEGNVVGGVENKAGEYWVYMAGGSNGITLHYPNAAPLKVVFADYGVARLEPRTTYTLRLAIEQTSDKGAINVDYLPFGATVTLDGKAATTSPDIFRDVKPGKHTVGISAGGYEPSTVTVRVGKGETADLRGALRPAANTGNAIVDNLIRNMVYVEGGTFKMGDKDYLNHYYYDNPLHDVTLSGFYIGKFEVTQEEWAAVMGLPQPPGESKFTGRKKPAANQSWDVCQQFIARLNELTGLTFRLPTEAEWEFAARGGNKSHGYKFAGSDDFSAVGWGGSKGLDTLYVDVGTKQPNELGLYDMSGNVSEWCQDWYGKLTTQPEVNPTGPPVGTERVRRGGSWYYDDSSYEVYCRRRSKPTTRGTNIGFRLAM